MKVRVVNLGPGHYGYVNHRRWKDGDEIELKERKTLRVNLKTGKKEVQVLTEEMQFSHRWMEKIDGKTSKKTITKPEQSDVNESSSPTGDQRVI